MPHLTLEYTPNLDQEIVADVLFARLHQVLAEVGGIAIGNCKSRIVCLDGYYIATGGPRNAFVHLTIRFLEGRAIELKQKVGRASLRVLDEYFAPSSATLDLQLTVEMQDIERATYFKIPEGTL